MTCKIVLTILFDYNFIGPFPGLHGIKPGFSASLLHGRARSPWIFRSSVQNYESQVPCSRCYCMRRYAAVLLFLASAAFPSEFPQDLPAHWNAERQNPIIDAAQIWRIGSDYIKSEDEFDHVRTQADFEAKDFKGVNGPELMEFFRSKLYLKPAVRFGCVVRPTGFEDGLEAALDKSDPEIRLQALSILLRIKAPHSVDLQFKALQELKSMNKGDLWHSLLTDMERSFEASSLEKSLKAPPLSDDHENEQYTWAIRAVGVIREKSELTRLSELSTSDDISCSLAAERSLEDFDGEDGDKALVGCLLGWKYNAYIRAAEALFKRNKALLNRTLVEAKVPDHCRYMQGIYLAKCDNTAAVPILCDTVSNYQIIDTEMFREIARLATADQISLVKKLPGRVRIEQKEAAEKVVRECLNKR
jgi:hypothetical protein